MSLQLFWYFTFSLQRKTFPAVCSDTVNSSHNYSDNIIMLTTITGLLKSWQ